MQAGSDRYDAECGQRGENRWTVNASSPLSKERRRNHAFQSKCEKHASKTGDRDQNEAFPKHKERHAYRRGAQRRTHSELPAAQSHRKAHDRVQPDERERYAQSGDGSHEPSYEPLSLEKRLMF